MPAFTFEKISPPAGGPVSSVANGSVPSTAKKQRGVIIQILDRLVETRVKRTSRMKKGVVARRQPK
jgi:DNA polymerase elongation subunit (family B)